MALLYSWATKEYLLWEMTIGQIIFYHNKGIEIKYGKPDGSRNDYAPGLVDKSPEELREFRDKMKAQYGDI